MLRRLLVENYALIEHLEIEFDSSLNIITGETGAGKSILMGALALLLYTGKEMPQLQPGMYIIQENGKTEIKLIQ